MLCHVVPSWCLKVLLLVDEFVYLMLFRYTPLQQCIHKVAKDPSERGFKWPALWPSRLEEPPYWLKGASLKGFTDDYNHWKDAFAKLYLDGIGVDWSLVRNVMDMRASYGG